MNHCSPYRLALHLQSCQFSSSHTSSAPLSHFPPSAHETILSAKGKVNSWVSCCLNIYLLGVQKPFWENQVSRIKADWLARLPMMTQQEQSCWLRKQSTSLSGPWHKWQCLEIPLKCQSYLSRVILCSRVTLGCEYTNFITQ